MTARDLRDMKKSVNACNEKNENQKKMRSK